MKAAVIHGFNAIPQWSEFPDPIPGEGEVLIEVLGAVLENFDKGIVKGNHYSSKKLYPEFPAIVGTDGVGRTKEGKLVSFGHIKPPYGAFAERALAGYTVPVPEDIKPAEASAIPSSVLTSLLPLKNTAKLKPGETVLINGATGVSGRIAVQVAKMLGAGRVIGTGRNPESLQLLAGLGADTVIDLRQSDEDLKRAFSEVGGAKGIDIVLDFVWGHPAEILISTFIPQEVGFAKRNIRYVEIGGMAGSHITLPAAALRTSGLQMMGVGAITWEILTNEMEAIWEGIRHQKFYMEILPVPLSEIAWAWEQHELAGKRIVLVP